jgi:hypothetical protein
MTLVRVPDPMTGTLLPVKMRSTTSWRRVTLVAVSGLVVLCGVSVFWASRRPPFSDEELAEAGAAIEAVRERLSDVECHRPAIPSGEPVDADASLASLLDPAGAYRTCLAAAGHQEAIDALDGLVPTADGVRRRWGFDVPRSDTPPPSASASRAFIHVQHPPYLEGEEPAAYVRVWSACSGVAMAVTQLAADDDACSPFPPDSAGWLDRGLEVVQLARAIAIVARGVARDGDLEAALTLLVRGAVVVQDLRRGPTSLVVAMLSVGAELTLWATFNSLLFPEPGPSAVVSAKMSELIGGLVDAWPHPHDVLAAESLAIPELARAAPITSEEAALAQMLAGEQARRLSQWCPRDGDPTVCFSSVPTVGAAGPGLFRRAWHLVSPNARLRSELQPSLDENARAYSRYYTRLLAPAVAIHVIRVMLALSGARQEGTCPTDADIDPRLLDVPFAAGPIEITHFDGAQYEVTAPPLTVDPTFERLVFYAVCPPVGGRWNDAGDSL